MKRILIATVLLLMTLFTYAGNVKGRVTADGKAVEGISVTDGTVIVHTDADGRYEFDSDKKSGTVSICTPSGYIALSIDGIRPGFWQYLVLPEAEDEIHDFQLTAQNQDRYSVLFPTDIHLVNDPRREDIRRFKDIVFPHICRRAEALGTLGPVYSFNLGDFTHDIYWYEFNFNESDGLRLLQDLDYPTPIYSVMGNHDHDGAVVGENVDYRAAWRYRNVWGPDRYSVNIGGDHWIFLDDIIYKNIEGQGKKAVGINGDRSYDHALTEAQIEWVKKDLEGLNPDVNVYLCCHAPVLRSTKKAGILLPKKQVALLNILAGNFKNGMTIFSGHIHCWDICGHENYPNLHQISLPATSGIMWETPADWKLTSSDGSDAGIFEAVFQSGKSPGYGFQTYIGGDIQYRVYDMNEVGKAYRSSPAAKQQKSQFKGSRLFYGDAKYRNCIYINYWGYRPGDTVHLYEKGKELKGEQRNDEDPVHNFAYDLPILDGTTPHHSPRAKDSCHHMYEFKSSGARTPLTLVIKDKDGNTRFEQEIVRPVPFNPEGR